MPPRERRFVTPEAEGFSCVLKAAIDSMSDEDQACDWDNMMAGKRRQPVITPTLYRSNT
jgi:hypothetical protein